MSSRFRMPRACVPAGRRLDEVQADLQICPRKPDGFLGGVSATADAETLNATPAILGSALERDGFDERAVDSWSGTATAHGSTPSGTS